MGGGESVTDFFYSLWPDPAQLITTGIHGAIYGVWLDGSAGITDTRRKRYNVRRLPRYIMYGLSSVYITPPQRSTTTTKPAKR